MKIHFCCSRWWCRCYLLLLLAAMISKICFVEMFFPSNECVYDNMLCVNERALECRTPKTVFQHLIDQQKARKRKKTQNSNIYITGSVSLELRQCALWSLIKRKKKEKNQSLNIQIEWNYRKRHEATIFPVLFLFYFILICFSG